MTTCEDCGIVTADNHPNLQLRTFHTRVDCIAALRRQRNDNYAKLDELARNVGCAIAAATLLDGESLSEPPEHEIVHLVDKLRREAQKFVRQVVYLREIAEEATRSLDVASRWENNDDGPQTRDELRPWLVSRARVARAALSSLDGEPS